MRLLYLLMTLSFMESVLALIARMLPHYTRSESDPRRNPYLMMLFVFNTHTYVSICKFFQFCGFYALFIRQCQGSLDKVYRSDTFIRNKRPLLKAAVNPELNASMMGTSIQPVSSIGSSLKTDMKDDLGEDYIYQIEDE
jgi:hypothetical protein